MLAMDLSGQLKWKESITEQNLTLPASISKLILIVQFLFKEVSRLSMCNNNVKICDK